MCFKKLKKLFVDPAKFFKEVSKEKGYWTILKFFVAVYLAATVIQILASIPLNLKLVEIGILSSSLTILLMSVVAAFISPFVASALSHLGVMLFGGKKGFFNTFKPITYSLIIVAGYGIVASIIILIVFLLNPENPGNIIFTERITNFISIIGMVHTLIAETIGVSMYHSISRGRALFGIILVPLVLLVLLVAIGVTFLAGLF